jgi:GDSL-like lipase/acylhydrolase family protein
MRRWGLTAGLLAAALIVLTPASSVHASHGRNLWSGQWTTSTGGFALRLFLPGDLAIAKQEPRRTQLWNKLPCKNGPQFYRGGYNNPDDRGKIMGCGTPTRLRGRWSSNDFPNANGSFDITITSRSPLRFKGKATPDGGKPSAWSGTWKSHFGDDGCCKGGTSKPTKKLPAHQCRRFSALVSASKVECKIVSYEMPERFGPDRDNDGLVDYMDQSTSATIAPAKWPVEMTVDDCDNKAKYQWTVDGKDVQHRKKGKCTFVLDFDEEGAYTVKFAAKGDGGRESIGAKEVIVQDWLIVGIGDSLASGEGNIETTRTGSNVWRPRRCHRSARSWQARLARQVEPNSGGNRDPETSVTFLHLGCSGASIERGLLGGYEGIVPGPDLPSQVDEVRRLIGGREVDALLVSIGVNEFAFGDVADHCARWPDCENRGFKGSPSLRQSIETAFMELPNEYDRLATALSAPLAPLVAKDRVYITEYPDFLNGPDGICDEILDDGAPWYAAGFDIGHAEAQWLFDHLLNPLNGQVAAAAQRNGWKLINGIAQPFRAHGYCAPLEARWIVTYAESMQNQATHHGALHPNRAGHGAIATLARAIVANDFYPGGETRRPRKKPKP